VQQRKMISKKMAAKAYKIVKNSRVVEEKEIIY
jgi:hypothetical protein